MERIAEFRGKPVYYLAHPVSGDHIGNALKAVRWIKWFHENAPTVIVVAPWVAEVLAYPETVHTPGAPGNFERVLPDDEAIVRRLDGVIAVGGRVSPGMAREMAAAKAAGLLVVDWSAHAAPPTGDFSALLAGLTGAL